MGTYVGFHICEECKYNKRKTIGPKISNHSEVHPYTEVYNPPRCLICNLQMENPILLCDACRKLIIKTHGEETLDVLIVRLTRWRRARKEEIEKRK